MKRGPIGEPWPGVTWGWGRIGAVTWNPVLTKERLFLEAIDPWTHVGVGGRARRGRTAQMASWK